MTDLLKALHDYAGPLQGISAIVLVIVTIVYVIATFRIANETRSMARATKEMADEARHQRLTSTLPVVAFRGLGWTPPSEQEAREVNANMPTASHFSVQMVNVGSGPGVDIRVEIVDSVVPYVARYQPGRDELQPTVLPPGASIELAFRPEGARDITRVEWESLSQTRLAGVLKASYRDIHGQSLSSEVRLVCREDTLADYFLELGPLRLEQPVQG